MLQWNFYLSISRGFTILLEIDRHQLNHETWEVLKPWLLRLCLDEMFTSPGREGFILSVPRWRHFIGVYRTLQWQLHVSMRWMNLMLGCNVSCRMLLVGSLFQRYQKFHSGLRIFFRQSLLEFCPEDVGLLQWIIVTPLKFNVDYLEDVFFLLGPGLVSGSMLV